MKLNLRTLYSVGTLLLSSQYVGAMQGAYNTNSSFTEKDRHGSSFDFTDTVKKDSIEQGESRDTERVQETIERSNKEKDYKENTSESKKLKSLRKAIRKNDEAEIYKLIEEIEDIDKERSHKGYTPLILAVSSNNANVVKKLIEKEVDINLTDKFGNTPLMIALLNDRREIAKLLIEQGADVKKANQDGETPLMAAASYGYKDMVKLLYKKRVDINLTDKFGNTPLMIALQNKHPSTAKFLIKHGADVEKANNDGYTPLMIAVFYGYANTVERLLKKGAKAEFNKLFLQKIKNYEKIVNLLKDLVDWRGVPDEDEDIQTKELPRVNSNDKHSDTSFSSDAPSIAARSDGSISTDSFSTSTNLSNRESSDSFNETDQTISNPEEESVIPIRDQSENPGLMGSNLKKGKQPDYGQVPVSDGKNSGQSQINNRNNYNDSRGQRGKRSSYNKRGGRGRGWK